MYKPPSELPTHEVLALTLKETSETAVQLLSKFPTLKDLATATEQEIQCAAKGIGPVKARQIVSAIELGKRLYSAPTKERPIIKTPADVYELLKDLQFLEYEVFKVLMLTTKHSVIAIDTISKGTLNSSLVHPRELFKPAIKRSAAALILCHNHPSQDTTPSEPDISITRRLKEAGELLGIEVLDHVIIGDSGYYSFKEHGTI